MGTWVRNVPEDRLTADELFAHTFGLDPERCRTGLPSEEALASVHPADRAGVNAAIAEALARGGPYRHQYRVQRHDGVYRWVEACGRVEMNECGQPMRFPGVLVDVTERKQAEESRNLLMREVNHRARNALAMVQAVVRLTDPSDPVRYQEAVIGRVDAMARAQGLLSRTNWSVGELEQLIWEELSSCASSEQFTSAGPNIMVSAEQVQPLSVMLHEMAANALKYGGLSAPGSTVEVSWEAAEGQQVVLTWRERGGPPVGPPEHKGFGSVLMKRLAAQLGGSIALDWRVTGLVATLRWRV